MASQHHDEAAPQQGLDHGPRPGALAGHLLQQGLERGAERVVGVQPLHQWLLEALEQVHRAVVGRADPAARHHGHLAVGAGRDGARPARRDDGDGVPGKAHAGAAAQLDHARLARATGRRAPPHVERRFQRDLQTIEHSRQRQHMTPWSG